MPEEDELYECERCGDEVFHEDAVAMTDGGAYYRILCPECVEEMGVPKGYELIRDVSRKGE